jgi:hypothetical protein
MCCEEQFQCPVVSRFFGLNYQGVETTPLFFWFRLQPRWSNNDFSTARSQKVAMPLCWNYNCRSLKHALRICRRHLLSWIKGDDKCIATDLRCPWKLDMLRFPRTFCPCIHRGLDPALEEDDHQAIRLILCCASITITHYCDFITLASV